MSSSNKGSSDSPPVVPPAFEAGIESGLSSRADPLPPTAPKGPETSKANANALCGGTFADLLSMSSVEMPLTLREHMVLFLDDPNSSTPALCFSLFIAFLVVVSTVAVVVESLPVFYGHRSLAWYYFEAAVMAVFTLELAARVYAHSSSWKAMRGFLSSFLTFVDLLAIVPYFAEWLVFREHFGGFQRLTVFRLFRLFRLVRCLSYSDVLQMSYDAFIIAITRSRDTLAAIVAFQSLLIIVFSTLIYSAERGDWDKERQMFVDSDGLPSRFSSIPATFWFVAQVITTVGLGDLYPRTVVGKLLTFPLMLFGLLIIALPSIVLGRNFSEAWHWLRTLPPGIRKRLHVVSLPDPLPDTRKHIVVNEGGSVAGALTAAQQVEMYGMLRDIAQDLRKRKAHHQQ